MFGALFAYGYAILLFFMVGEVDTLFLRWCGYLAGVWMLIAGSIVGWRAARNL